MLKILLADDDMLVLDELNDIISSIDDVMIVGQALNGKTAIELTSELSPHLVILDIDMPVLNGVQVAEHLSVNSPNIKILALSNYDNFQFVKPIMKFGAIDYILKHELNRDLIENKLHEVRSMITRQKDNQAIIRQYETMTKAKQIELLITETNQDKLITKSEQGSMILKNHALVVMQILGFIRVTQNGQPERRDQLIKSVMNICHNIFNTVSNGLVIYTQNGEFVIVFDFSHIADSMQTKALAEKYLTLISSNIQKILEIKTVYNCCIFSDELSNILFYYRKAQNELVIINLSDNAYIGSIGVHEEYPVIIKQVLEYIYQNYMHDISLTDISTITSLSEPYISKLFKAVINTSFTEYLCNLRISKSKTLLDNTDLSLKEIAKLSGFRNYNYFISVFKNKTGFSPTLYRRNSSALPPPQSRPTNRTSTPIAD